MTSSDSDHEILLKLQWDLRQLVERHTEVLKQLERGNARFEQIALKEQEVALSLVSLRNDFSRAMLSADGASRSAADALALSKTVLRDFQSHLKDAEGPLREFKEVRKTVEDLKDELDRWKNNLKLIGIALAPLQIVLIAIIIEYIKRFLFGP